MNGKRVDVMDEAAERMPRARRRVAFRVVGAVCLMMLALAGLGLLVGCGSRTIAYDPAAGFTYNNTGQDTAFGALDVQRRTVTETLDPATGEVVERVTEETTVVVDAYQGADAVARTLGQVAEALKEVAAAVPGN